MICHFLKTLICIYCFILSHPLLVAQGQHSFHKGLVPVRKSHSDAEQHEIENECLGMAVLAITHTTNMGVPGSHDVR